MALVLIGGATLVKAQGVGSQTVRDYRNIIELDPDFAEAWWMRGNAYWDAGDYDRALADYNKTITLDPNYAMAYLGRGNVYLRKGDYDGALDEYNQVVEVLPEFIGTYNTWVWRIGKRGSATLRFRVLILPSGSSRTLRKLSTTDGSPIVTWASMNWRIKTSSSPPS
jgi:tetratricopeptide (TPR) repeat protein